MTVESEGDLRPISPEYCLRLDLLFPRLPADEEMGEMCDGLIGLIPEKRPMPQKIVWNALHRKEVLPPVARATAHRWLSETLTKKWRSSLSEDCKTPSDNISGSPTESSPLETTESPILKFAQNSRTNGEHKLHFGQQSLLGTLACARARLSSDDQARSLQSTKASAPARQRSGQLDASDS
jgi:hypothetical protein